MCENEGLLYVWDEQNYPRMRHHHPKWHVYMWVEWSWCWELADAGFMSSSIRNNIDIPHTASSTEIRRCCLHILLQKKFPTLFRQAKAKQTRRNWKKYWNRPRRMTELVHPDTSIFIARSPIVRICRAGHTHVWETRYSQFLLHPSVS